LNKQNANEENEVGMEVKKEGTSYRTISIDGNQPFPSMIGYRST
jgi:hypothetical protein